MPTPYELALAFRRRLLQRERAAEQILIQAYAGIQGAIERRLEVISRKMIEAVESGKTINESWLYEQGRLSELKRQIESELRRYNQTAAGVIAGNQQAILFSVTDDALAQITASLPPGLSIAFNRLPLAAIQSLAGRLSDGSPLRDYLDKYASDYASHAASILRDGLALGRNPRTIARDLIKTAGMPRNKAIAISRDTILGSYRDSALETYRENADVVQGWLWLSSLGGRSCAMCVAMHGTFHELSEPFYSHSLCRCTTVPATDSRERFQSGITWFNSQPADVKREVLGSEAAYRAYRVGEVKLQDFVGKSYSERWGSGRYQKSLKQVLGAERAREFYITSQ